MAIARLSMKVGKAGKAGPHAAYIARKGEYAHRLEKGEALEATEAGNMPLWAQADPLAFWRAADAFERANGTTYREMEIALPRELDAGQRIELVREFVRQEIGDRHAYQWATHNPQAADGGEQPHAHLMFSERQCDGIERDPEQYFRRYNAKHPERGGARKGYGPHAGQTLTAAERKTDLVALRGRWEATCNVHLERAGLAERIDMRSHAERQTGQAPERKQLPSAWRGEGRAQVIEFRTARAQVAQAAVELRRVVPDAGAEVLSLEAERQRRQQAKEAQGGAIRHGASQENPRGLDGLIQRMRAEVGEKALAEAEALRQQLAQERERRREAQREKLAAVLRQEQEQLRIERMSAAELRVEIERQRPVPLAELVERDPAVIEAVQAARVLVGQAKAAQAREDQARREAREWREAHPLRAKAHDAGLVRSSYLDERAQVIEQAQEQYLEVAPQAMRAREATDWARNAAAVRIAQALEPAQEHIRALEQRMATLEHAEREKQAQAQQERQAEGEARLLVRELRGMAALLSCRGHGWTEGGKKLQALHDPAVKEVRTLVEGLAALPQETQRDYVAEKLVGRLAKDPANRLRLSEQMAQVKHGPEHDRDHGMSR
ncbi:MobA/MobL family protein [Azotobacter beijerinckii]|uniref:MobA/MobL family protein n=1 Tax=Azotobacter beijerinckii TaxID=170623 RepID=A0A1H9QPT1_9GAMM|nr:MobA/MobL family protein [Azotobacter beijerinckii]SER62235.1 MobA/MobL family protein [Azotobacter beijerinckii]